VLLLAEVAGAMSRRTADATLARRAVTAILLVPTVRLVAVDQRLAHVAAQLAGDLGLRGADAMYAATAMELNVPLVTWDQDQLARAGQRIAAGSP